MANNNAQWLGDNHHHSIWESSIVSTYCLKAAKKNKRNRVGIVTNHFDNIDTKEPRSNPITFCPMIRIGGSRSCFLFMINTNQTPWCFNSFASRHVGPGNPFGVEFSIVHIDSRVHKWRTQQLVSQWFWVGVTTMHGQHHGLCKFRSMVLGLTCRWYLLVSAK